MWYYAALHGHIRRILESAHNDTAGPLLDAGCGTGGLIRRMERWWPRREITGVDCEPVACALSRERTRAKIVEADLTALPFSDDAFATVVTADVLYHIDDDEAALRELFRVTRPGGLLVINVPAYRWLWSYHDVAVHSRRRYGSRELRRKLHAAGFDHAEITHWNMFLLPLIAARRKLLPAPVGGSDVQAYSAWTNRLLANVMKAESGLLNICDGLPAGSSLLAVARKPPQAA